MRSVPAARKVPGVPAEEGSASCEVLAALVASLRRELADAVAVVAETRAELGRAREPIAELEARLRQNPAELITAAGRGAGQPSTAVAAEQERAQAWRAGRAQGRNADAGGAPRSGDQA